MNDLDPTDPTDPTGAPAPATPDPDPAITEPVAPVPVAPVEAPVGPVEEPLDAQAPPPEAPRAGGVRTQNRVAVIGTVVLVVALAFGAGFAVGRGTSTGGGSARPGAVLVPATPAASAAPGASGNPGGGSGSPAVPTSAPSSGPALPSDGARLGNADAKVVVDYFADFQCPFCAKFARESIPQLVPLIADGTVALVHRDFAFIGPESIDAAVAVRCAGRDGKFWAMHDAVYAAQNGENKGAFSRPNLAAIGQSIGLDGTRLEACLDDRALLVDVLDDTSRGMRIGVTSTPTIVVNGTNLLGVPDMAKLRSAIDAAVAGATPAPRPSPSSSPNPWSALPTTGRVAGDPAAPVVVDLWMDYQASESVALNAALAPELRTRIADGKLRAVLHDLALLGDESVAAASAVRCTAAQDGPTWFVHDILASAGQGRDAGIYTPRNLLQLATQLGMDVRAFDSCLADPATARAVGDETAQGQAAGLTAAPAIIVSSGGAEKARFTGAADPAKVLQAIDAAK